VLTDKNVSENGATLERSETKSLVGLAQQTSVSVLSPQIHTTKVLYFYLYIITSIHKIYDADQKENCIICTCTLRECMLKKLTRQSFNLCLRM
jgi:hypothetical protein